MHLTLPILTCLLSWQFAPSTLTLLWNYDAAGNQSLFRNFLLEVDSQVELTSLTLLPYVELLEALCQGPRNAAQVSLRAIRSRCSCLQAGPWPSVPMCLSNLCKWCAHSDWCP